jgi:hypothetical protein
MPALSDRIRVSKDGQYVLATGKHTCEADTPPPPPPGIYRTLPTNQCCGSVTFWSGSADPYL